MPVLCHKQRFCRLLFLVLGALFVQLPAANAILRGSNATALNGQVQVFVLNDTPTLCTGSLISSSWVLTANHCLPQGLIPNGVTIYLGDLGLRQGEMHLSSTYVRNATYDVALVKLAVPASNSSYIQSYGIGLLDDSDVTLSVTVQGWGATAVDPPKPAPPAPPANVLQTATMGVLIAENGLVTLTEKQGLPTDGDSGAGISYQGLVCGVESSSALNRQRATGTSTDAVFGWILLKTLVRPGGSCAPPGKRKACEILSSQSVICAAAYSTARSLYSSFKGRLYQVTRGSDRTSADIGVASTGYADAAAQDEFCANTTCTISKIYDQSPYLNDLSIEGPGGNKQSADSGAVANALPIMLNGNKVYGVSVTPGVGYRNNNTTGIARNVGPPPVNMTPEGMYMVTSGKNVNGACCFDFGNAETSGNDVGNGHMDALNVGTFCGFPPCSGSGPWVEADLENGQYMGGGSNPSNLFNISLTGNFVAAMLKNDSQSIFSLSGGNLGSNTFFRLYDGSLPTQKPNYVPMQLEGAIVLGTGGDNSAGGVGSFFEGAMTSGYPSDATEEALYANINAAGYSGSSSPTNGEAPVYTGPSDPNGPGPQDGFAPTAVEQPNTHMGSKPALAAFKGSLYAAFQANDASHFLYVTSTPTGTNFPGLYGYGNIQMGSAPALAVFRHALYVAFQANDNSHALFVTSSTTGSGFPKAAGYGNIQMGSAPAMAEFNSDLYVAFQGNADVHTLFLTHSQDGKTWPKATPVTNVQIGSAPAMAVFHSDLYVAFRANDTSDDVWIAKSTDGVNFTSKRIDGPVNPQTTGPSSAPTLVVSNGVIYCIYGADDLANEMLVMASTDGTTWQGPNAYLGNRMGASGPGAAAFGDGITVGFQSDDARNVLFITSKATEADAYTGPSDPNGSGPQDGFASLASGQPKNNMGSKPAVAGYQGQVHVAYQANDDSDYLYITSTTPGSTFPTAQGYGKISIGSAPAMAEFNNGSTDELYIASQADDDSHALFITSSSDGKSFPKAAGYGNVRMGSAPALAVFNNKLYAAFQANDDSHVLFMTSSKDGTTWPNSEGITNVRIGSAPSMAVYGNNLYVAFRADDTSNDVWIASSSDGVNFTSHRIGGPVTPQQMNWNSSPALVSYDGYLFCIYAANDFGNEMLVTSSQDGVNWDGPKLYSGIQMSDAGPSAGVLNGLNTGPYYAAVLGFQANDASNVLFVTADTSGN